MNGNGSANITHTPDEKRTRDQSRHVAGCAASPLHGKRHSRRKPASEDAIGEKAGQVPPYPKRGTSALVVLAIALAAIMLACAMASPAVDAAYAEPTVYSGSMKVGDEIWIERNYTVDWGAHTTDPDGEQTYCCELMGLDSGMGGYATVHDLVGYTCNYIDVDKSLDTELSFTFTQTDVTTLALAHEWIFDNRSGDDAVAAFQRYVWYYTLVSDGRDDVREILDGDNKGDSRGHSWLLEVFSESELDQMHDYIVAEEASGAVIGRGFAFDKIHGTGHGTQNEIKVWLEPATGQVELSKSSANESITDGNECYSLKGAEYTVYSDSACTSAVTALTTNESGYAKSGDIVAGAYYVKETKAAPGYALDKNVYSVTVNAGETVSVNGSEGVKDTPQNDPADILLAKVDAETGKASPLGAGQLADAQFTLKYYDGYYATAEEAQGSGEPTATWVLATDKDGFIYLANLDDEHIISTSGHGLYKNSAGSYCLPLGTYTIQETKAPVGYLADNTIYVRTVTSEGSAETVSTYNALTEDAAVAEQVKRGDVSFTKDSDATGKRLANVPFLITSNITGESHVVVTDENGCFDSSASYSTHESNTNAYDAAYDSATGTIDEEKLAQIIEETGGAVGTWFGMDAEGTEAPANDSLCALPYDTYALDELACSANEGLQLITGQTFTVSRDSYPIRLGTIDDPTPTISTVASDAEDGDSAVAADVESTITDTVTYAGMLVGSEGVMSAQLVDVETGETVAESDTEFVSEGSGKVVVGLAVNTSQLAGHELTVVETLYLNGLPKANHNEGLDESDQTVTVIPPSISTTATDAADGDQEVVADDEATMIDTVAYENLYPGRDYVMTGTLHVKAEDGTDAGELLDADGNPVTASVEFTPEEASGEVEIVFTFDASLLAGEELVAFESCTRNGKEVAAHADITDESQTVTIIPTEIGTTAADAADGDKAVAADEDAAITDTVAYSGAIQGADYTIAGIIMDASTGLPLLSGEGASEIESERLQAFCDALEAACGMSASEGESAEAAVPYSIDSEMIETAMADYADVAACVSIQTLEFAPEEADGEVEMTFSVNARDVASTDVVVFEYLVKGGLIVAEHTDITDEGQTVTIEQPEIGTTATDATDGDHCFLPSTTTEIVDSVTYSNLIPGKEYKLSGKLVSKTTGEALVVNDEEVVATVTFVPNSASGIAEVVFKFDSTGLSDGSSYVAFEYLYKSGVEDAIAEHADLSDETQTVAAVRPPTDTSFSKTGGSVVWVFAALGALLMGSGAAGRAYWHRKHHDAADDDPIQVA